MTTIVNNTAQSVAVENKLVSYEVDYGSVVFYFEGGVSITVSSLTGEPASLMLEEFLDGEPVRYTQIDALTGENVIYKKAVSKEPKDLHQLASHADVYIDGAKIDWDLVIDASEYTGWVKLDEELTLSSAMSISVKTTRYSDSGFILLSGDVVITNIVRAE